MRRCSGGSAALTAKKSLPTRSLRPCATTVSAGPALRVDPSLGVGGELRGAISIFGVQAGARVIAVGMHGFDLQPTITLGYGFD